MLTIHHLGKSQSERIVWLCEELGVPYELTHHNRNAVTILSPPELKALHPLGAAPVITDGALVLAESGAIMEYIIAMHGGGRLALGPTHPDFAHYLYWFHFANSNLQSIMGRCMFLRRLDLAAENAVFDDGTRLGEDERTVGDHGRSAQRVKRLEFGRRKHGDRVADVAFQLVRNAQLFAEPDDAL